MIILKVSKNSNPGSVAGALSGIVRERGSAELQAIGAAAVNQGEILYQRRETGRSVNEKDLALSYHPVKGIVNALLGSVPFMLCALLLALLTERQVAQLGALPGWISGMERREEIGAALAYYHVNTGMELVDVMRVVIRMCIMPYVNILGASNADAMLVLERLSPVLMLLPAVCHGLGYMQGVKARTRVHSEIAAGKRKQKRREKKRRQQRMQQRGPQQLN